MERLGIFMVGVMFYWFFFIIVILGCFGFDGITKIIFIIMSKGSMLTN